MFTPSVATKNSGPSTKFWKSRDASSSRTCWTRRSHEALEARIRPLLDATAPCQGNFYGFATKRLSGLIAKSKACRQMSVEPHILAVMDEFLLRSCRAYQLNLTQAIQIGPGEPQQLIHADDLMFSFEHPGREAMINCMWAVDDFTKENGATLLVPGSHRWPRDRTPEPHEIAQGEMSKGSVLIYFGSLLHAGGANRTDTSRTGIVISYCLGWLRQAENQYLAVPPEIARDLPEELQRLLGYFVHEPNLGSVEGQDPIRMLKEGRDRCLPVSGVHPEGGAADARRTPRKNAGCLNNFRGRGETLWHDPVRFDYLSSCVYALWRFWYE